MSEQDAAGGSRESYGCVLGIAVTLLVVLGMAASLLQPAGGTRDPAEVLGRHFAWDELPYGLELDRAAALPTGDVVVRIAHPDEPMTPPPAPEGDGDEEGKEAAGLAAEVPGEGASQAGAEEGESSGSSSEPEGEPEGEPGSEVAEGDPEGEAPPEPPPAVEGTAPREVYVLFARRAASAVQTFEGRKSPFGGGGGGGRGGPPGGMMFGEGPISMDRGELDWGDLRVGFRHSRKPSLFTFTEEIRVNLSGAGRYCVLVARWPEQHAASTEPVEELLAALRLASTEPHQFSR